MYMAGAKVGLGPAATALLGGGEGLFTLYLPRHGISEAA